MAPVNEPLLDPGARLASLAPRLALLVQHLAGRALRRGLSAEVEALVVRLMARQREERYPRRLDLASDLSAVAEGRPTQAGALRAGFARRCRRGLCA